MFGATVESCCMHWNEQAMAASYKTQLIQYSYTMFSNKHSLYTYTVFNNISPAITDHKQQSIHAQIANKQRSCATPTKCRSRWNAGVSGPTSQTTRPQCIGSWSLPATRANRSWTSDTSAFCRATNPRPATIQTSPCNKHSFNAHASLFHWIRWVTSIGISSWGLPKLQRGSVDLEVCRGLSAGCLLIAGIRPEGKVR